MNKVNNDKVTNECIIFSKQLIFTQTGKKVQLNKYLLRRQENNVEVKNLPVLTFFVISKKFKIRFSHKFDNVH